MIIEKINEWLTKEKELGSADPDRIVLATSSKTGQVRSRVVAIREITEEGILFFTQRETRKVADLTENPSASMTLWLPLQQREVILDGSVRILSQQENQRYWDTLPHERQVRFSTYAPLSGQPIASLSELDSRFQALLKEYENKKMPMSEFYYGYCFVPQVVYFYTLGGTQFSEVLKHTKTSKGWINQLLSP